MGLKLSRKIRSLKNKILDFIEKKNYLFYKIIILPFSILKFIYRKNRKKNYKKFSKDFNEISKKEFRITSQNNEDGIIKFLLEIIGSEKINFFEIGFDYYENNSLNLIKRANKGVYIDGSDKKVFLLKSILSFLYPFKNIFVIKKFITKENINEVVSSHFSKNEEIDFFSIDLDGNDYYILEALNFKPKIICIEYNFWFGPEIKCSIPYDENFKWKMGSLYSGASINALVSLAKKKGYHLVALETNCVNAFFVRSDFKDKFKILDQIENYRIPERFNKEQVKNSTRELLKEKLVIFD